MALLISFGSMVLAYFAIRSSWEIAEASGSFDKSGIEVGLGGYPLTVGRPNYIVVGSSEISSPNLPVVGVLPFTFRSIGKRSLESLAVSFQYYDNFNRQILEQEDLKIWGAFATMEVKKNTSATANRFFVSYAIAILNPGVTLYIDEPIFLTETYIRDIVSVTTKDGVKMIIPYEASYSKNCGLAVSARDTQILGACRIIQQDEIVKTAA